MKILLVEDSPTYAKLATVLLRGCGHEVLRASAAAEGLRIAQEEKPDLILMDIHLPGLDGFDAVKLLRMDPAGQNVVAIAMTADRIWNEEERERAAVAGFDAYVEKPFTEVTFQELLEPFMGSPAHGSSNEPDAA